MSPYVEPTPPSASTPDAPAVTQVLVEGDATKLCLATHDGHQVESVIIPMGGRIDGRDKTWRTLCVSCQVGCSRGCTFCQTARMGLVRNLTVGEILGQVRIARTQLGADIRNVVFMGMGEPMDNLDNVIAAIRAMHDDREHQIPRRRVAVSTVGRCDGIRRLAALRWRRLGLAVSLNAPNDAIRSRIMPINRTDPMPRLREAIAEYPVRGGGHVLIEYVMLRDLNDQPGHARELVEYLRGLRTCVNMIPYNPIDGAAFEPSTDAATERFRAILMESGQLVFRRDTKGRSQMAACGQLGRPGASRRRPPGTALSGRQPAIRNRDRQGADRHEAGQPVPTTAEWALRPPAGRIAGRPWIASVAR